MSVGAPGQSRGGRLPQGPSLPGGERAHVPGPLSSTPDQGQALAKFPKVLPICIALSLVGGRSAVRAGWLIQLLWAAGFSEFDTNN